MSMRNSRTLAIFGLLVASTSAVSACGESPTSTGATSSGGSGSTLTGGGTGQGAGSVGGGGTAGTAGSGGVVLTGGGGTGAGTTTTTTSTGSGPIVEAPCANHTYDCGDTLDNDNDGLIDSQDPDCLGPCDNTESSFYGGISGQPGPPCTVDCYWDANSGSGDDECYWTHECDPNEVGDPGHPEPASKCPYDPDANVPGTNLTCDTLKMTQSDVCGTVCGPLTPNGCDCFGCCELPAGGGKFVWLGSEDEATGEGSCTIADIADPLKCEPCLPVPSCLNDCGLCELCIGKTTVPPECNPSGTGGSGGAGPGGGGPGGGGAGGGGSMQCPSGVQPCGLPGQASCGVDYYCVTGCCQPIQVPE